MNPAPSTLLEEKLHLRARDGTGLFARRVAPREGARARLLWVHGFAEHGGRYLPTLTWFAERGFDSWILDLRGHGRSEGRRTFVTRFADYLDDLQAFHQEVGRSDELPRFALGHSMGGLVLARTLQERGPALPSLREAVILSPFLGVKAKLPRWKTVAGRVLSRVAPWAAIPTDLNLHDLSKDPAVWEAYATDPLVAKHATARWYTETVGNHPLAIAEARRIDLPVLVMHGEDDGLADPERARDFHIRLASADKELRMWPGLRHELLNEVEQLAVREHLLGWLEPRLG